MVKGAPRAAYNLWIEAEVHQSRHLLPGKVRQRIKKLVEGLGQHPRPASSRSLETSELNLPGQVEIRRLRLENWRILYAVNDEQGWVWILAIRRRPPYDYGDLAELAAKLTE